MKSVAFGGQEHERVEISVHGYERPPRGEYFDDNWLRVGVSIHAGAFSGGFGAAFLTAELESFHEQLSSLHETLKGEARFQTLEEQLSLVLKGNGLGHIELAGEALDQPGIGSRLCFTISLDQSHLRSSLESLRAVLATFPVRT